MGKELIGRPASSFRAEARVHYSCPTRMWWRNTHPQPRNTQRGAVRSVSSGAHDIRCRTGGMVASQTSSRHSEPRLIGHGRGAGQPGEARRAYGDSRQEPRQRPGRKVCAAWDYHRHTHKGCGPPCPSMAGAAGPDSVEASRTSPATGLP
ncbi:MAG: hypothetical protein WDW38_003238 [Sanguina aurantia]